MSCSCTLSVSDSEAPLHPAGLRKAGFSGMVPIWRGPSAGLLWRTMPRLCLMTKWNAVFRFDMLQCCCPDRRANRGCEVMCAPVPAVSAWCTGPLGVLFTWTVINYPISHAGGSGWDLNQEPTESDPLKMNLYPCHFSVPTGGVNVHPAVGIKASNTYNWQALAGGLFVISEVDNFLVVRKFCTIPGGTADHWLGIHSLNTEDDLRSKC